jgi:hypothetical protein
MQLRIESKNLMLLQTAGNLLRGLLQLFMCCRQQLLLAAMLIICSGSSGVLIGCAAGRSSDDSSVMDSFTSLRTVHKYSESAREIMLERYGDDHPAASWPVQGSIEYYQLLRNQDGARLAAAASGSRRHLLSTASSTTAYTFFEGNETEESTGKWVHLCCKSNYVDRSLYSEDLVCNLNILIAILGADSPVLWIWVLVVHVTVVYSTHLSTSELQPQSTS